MEIRLDGKTALITGGAGGLGTSIAENLALSGAQVICLDRRVEHGQSMVAEINARIGKCGPAVSFLEADLSDPVRAASIVAQTAVRTDGIDILVNNAAINPSEPVDRFDFTEFETVQRVNAHAAFALVQATVGAMKQKRSGVIINICSITLNGGWKDFSAYVASKGTLLGLTRSLARELGEWNIRVNAVSPGAIPTALETEVWGGQLERYTAFILERQALPYRGSPCDVANLTVFLASDAARFITGQNLNIDGGWWMT